MEDVPELESQFIYVVGPTATGKTELSLQISKTLQIPVINADSIQVYSRVAIGTAKPSKEELEIGPHYLFDYVEPPRRQTVADYIDDVQQLLKTKSIERACFTGGSGFYLQALEKGLFPQSETPETVKKTVEKSIHELGFEKLYLRLSQRDPQWARGISPNDHYRVRRAAEVFASQGRTISEMKNEMASGRFSPLPRHRALKVGLTDSRENLLKRVELRTERMLQMGLIGEVLELREEGLGQWPPLSSVGYKEVQAFLDNELSEKDLKASIVTSTMQLIKKQKTWFKRDPDIIWFRPEEADKALSQIVEWSKSH